ncbi:YtxH domain-containing protein [Gorillibacterium sp. sgz5001074]|uniref:YtxH domain-containing protein n=1 Tax=Gorillibacterium sp. sgz5001074 TaxID=3446695 RepID=UPI003F6637A9
MTNKRNGKEFLVGAVVGSVLGAVTALLLAPKSGKELRSDLSEQYGKVSDKTVEIAGVVGAKTQEIAGVVGAKTHEIAGVVGAKSQEIAKTVGEHTGEIVGKAKDVAGVVATEVKAWREARKEASAGAEAVEIEGSVVEEEPVAVVHAVEEETK